MQVSKEFKNYIYVPLVFKQSENCYNQLVMSNSSQAS